MGEQIQINKEDVKMFKLNTTKIIDETIFQVNSLRAEVMKEDSNIQRQVTWLRGKSDDYGNRVLLLES